LSLEQSVKAFNVRFSEMDCTKEVIFESGKKFSGMGQKPPADGLDKINSEGNRSAPDKKHFVKTCNWRTKNPRRYVDLLLLLWSRSILKVDHHSGYLELWDERFHAT
jgi:hypothetical protein